MFKILCSSSSGYPAAFSMSLAVLLASWLCAQRRVRRRLRARFPFRATNYDVEAILHPEDQTISAQAKVDFVANEVARTVLVELHPDLQSTR